MHMILSWGLGVESTAILTRWLTEATSRDFALSDLIVLTAQVGNEYASTVELAETHVLPLLRRNAVRFVQVARGGRCQADGIVVLDDSRSPERIVAEGRYKLSDELSAAGTVPTFAASTRKCSQKFKGFVLDSWLQRKFGSSPYRQAIGFNADETRRAERDFGYSTSNRNAVYPLIEWGWTRQTAADRLLGEFGVRWPKSACVFCPFSGGKAEAVERYVREPEAALQALAVEFTAMSLNPRMALFSTGSLREKLIVAGHADLVDESDRVLSGMPWGLYRVRRIASTNGSTRRAVECLLRADRGECRKALDARSAELGVPLSFEGGIARCYAKRMESSSSTEKRRESRSFRGGRNAATD